MTFPEAQQLAKKYEFLIGTRTKSGDATIVAIIIEKVGKDHLAKAFYYPEKSSNSNSDSVEDYEDRLAYCNLPKRGFSVYPADHQPYSIESRGDIIVNANGPAVSWIGKTLQEIKPIIQEMEAKVIESIG